MFPTMDDLPRNGILQGMVTFSPMHCLLKVEIFSDFVAKSIEVKMLFFIIWTKKNALSTTVLSIPKMMT